MGGKEAESLLRRALEQHSQGQPMFHVFSESGQAGPRVRDLETLSYASGPGQEVWLDRCVHSELAGQRLWRGPPVNAGHHSSVAAFSSNRKNIQGTGNLLLFADIGKPEVPRAAFVTIPG